MHHGDQLSDVLINKWTNRKSLRQLAAYDYARSEAIAEACAMPDSPELTELSDGLTKIRGAEEALGLTTQMIVVSDAHVKMTSMKDKRVRQPFQRGFIESSGTVQPLRNPREQYMQSFDQRPCRIEVVTRLQAFQFLAEFAETHRANGQ